MKVICRAHFILLRGCRTEIDDYMAILKYPVCYKSRAGRDNLIIGTSEHLTPGIV